MAISLKQHRTHCHTARKSHNWQRMLVQPLLLSLCVLATGITADSQKWQVRQNVSCIAHDTKFTCDCQNVNQPLLLPRLEGFVFQVEVSNCKSLTVEGYSLADTQGLRKIHFKNIENLVLNKFALSFPRFASNTPLIIEFEKVNFEIIDSHAIDGNIEEISFIGGRIEVIHPFGFTTLKDHAILLKLDNVLIKRIEQQAFKKFAVDEIDITNCVFESDVPSKTFYELEVLHSLRMNNVRFAEVHTHAFSFKLINKLSITNNYFEAANAEWIEAHVRENVVIRDNDFGTISPIAFKGIAIHRDYMLNERLEMRFANNTVHFAADPRPLEFSDRFALSIKQLRYDNTYTCKDVDARVAPPQPKNEFFRKHIDNLYFLREDPNRKSSAVVSDNQSFVALNKIIELDCQQRSYLVFIVAGVSTLVGLIVVIAALIWLFWAKKRKRRKMNVVLPEPRTYKETQIVYQIENAGLLKTDL